MQPHNAVVLGASGLVGQRMQQRLANHPWFRLAAVVGSQRTAGKTLESIEWNLQEPRPRLPNLTVLSSEDERLLERLKEVNITVAFSCLPASIADPLELMLASSGIAVFSNASAFRRCDGVPLVIPDVNPTHLDQFEGAGYTLACATNCTLIPLAVPVAALSHDFGVTHVTMNSEQALSGAGYELVLNQTALDGEHPTEIEGEAEKTGAELLHVLGDALEGKRRDGNQRTDWRNHPAFSDSKNHINAALVEVDVHCKRVTRVDGHQIFATVTQARSHTRRSAFMPSDMVTSTICTNLPKHTQAKHAPRRKNRYKCPPMVGWCALFKPTRPQSRPQSRNGCGGWLRGDEQSNDCGILSVFSQHRTWSGRRHHVAC